MGPTLGPPGPRNVYGLQHAQCQSSGAWPLFSAQGYGFLSLPPCCLGNSRVISHGYALHKGTRAKNRGNGSPASPPRPVPWLHPPERKKSLHVVRMSRKEGCLLTSRPKGAVCLFLPIHTKGLSCPGLPLGTKHALPQAFSLPHTRLCSQNAPPLHSLPLAAGR